MSHHTTIHRLVRPAVRMAARARLTPNQVTTMRLATGLAAAVLFAQGTYGLMGYGAFICLISLLLDRVDGDLARLTNQKSTFGYRYDLISDCIASVATFIGLGIGVSYADGSDALWLGVLAGLGIGVLFFELNILNVVDVPGHELFGGRLTVDPDDAMIFVPILIWCDLASETVTAAAILAPLAAIGVAGLGLRRWRASSLGDDARTDPGRPGG